MSTPKTCKKKAKSSCKRYKEGNRWFINKTKRLARAVYTHPTDAGAARALASLKPYWTSAKRELQRAGARYSEVLT